MLYIKFTFVDGLWQGLFEILQLATQYILLEIRDDTLDLLRVQRLLEVLLNLLHPKKHRAVYR